MTTGKRTPRGGKVARNLRSDLLRVARQLLERDGHCWFVRDAAKALGVTSAAPYKHFPNRISIEVELARNGFDELAEYVRISPESRRVVWFDWAGRNPQLFALMFAPGMRNSMGRNGLDVDERVLGEVIVKLWNTGEAK